MSFLHFISISNYATTNLVTPIILNGDYELGIYEYFIDNLKISLGNLEVGKQRGMISLEVNRLDSLKCGKMLGVDYCIENKNLKFNNKKPFSFDRRKSDANNSLQVNIDKYKTIYVLANIVENTSINGYQVPLLKKIVYNEKNKIIDYFNVKTRYIKNIEISFLDFNFRNLNNNYNTSIKNHFFVLHFKKKNEIS